TSMRQIDSRYQIAIPNNLASRLIFGKVLKKRECKVLIEHWTITQFQNILFEVVNKCKGCTLNMLKNKQSCIGYYPKHAIIGAIPLSKKLKERDQLLVLFSMFKNIYRDNEFVGISESRLEKLETVEEMNWLRIEALTGKQLRTLSSLMPNTKWTRIQSQRLSSKAGLRILAKPDTRISVKQFKLSAYHSSSSMSIGENYSYKNGSRSCIGLGSGSSKVPSNTGNQKRSENKELTLVLK
ncbi:20842_t:CDS:2, partial [Gigaspora margarita]